MQGVFLGEPQEALQLLQGTGMLANLDQAKRRSRTRRHSSPTA